MTNRQPAPPEINVSAISRRMSEGYLAPHGHCIDTAKLFLRKLEAAHTEGRPGLGDVLPDYIDTERQAFSESVQVFAAMAVECAINFVGILSLGEEEFYRFHSTFPRKTPEIRRILPLATVVDADRDAEACDLAKKIADRRNRIVHVRARSLSTATADDQLSMKHRTLDEARLALADARRLIQLLGCMNPTLKPMLLVL